MPPRGPGRLNQEAPKPIIGLRQRLAKCAKIGAHMNRHLVALTLALCAASSVVSCKKLLNRGGSEDAGIAPTPTDTTTPTAAPTGADTTTPTALPVNPSTPGVVLAANADDVARFGEEVKLADVPATVTTPSANIRESPPNGPLVSIVPRGTPVVEIASRDAYFLVTFDNPRKAGERLMGWVFGASIGQGPAVIKTVDGGRVDAAVPPPKPPPTSCGPGITLVMGDQPFCARLCEKDSECLPGQACKGSANRIVNGRAGDAVTTCVAYHHIDGGAPKVVDAAAPPVAVDAAVPPKVDAAAPTPVPAGPEVPAVGGKCDAGYVFLAKDGKCHRDCSASPGACGGARCTKKCNTPVPICVVNAATCG